MAVYQTRTSTWSGSAAVGPLTEGAAGIAVIVLTILALAAVSPGILTAIAVIVVGVGLFVQATNAGIEYSHAGSVSQSGAEVGQLGGDISVQVLAGIVGVVLGVLALIGAATAMSLLPAALIVFGGALILAGMSATRIGRVSQTEAGTSIAWSSDLAPSRGLQVLIGVAAVVLGILAYVLPSGGVLLVIGLLAVGTALLATSANFTRSFMSMFAA